MLGSRQLQGKFYDGLTSGSRHCTMSVDDSGIAHFTGVDLPTHSLPFGELTVPARVANAARSIRLPGGESFETRDNDALEELIKHYGKSTGFNAHKFESSFKYVFATLIVIAGLVYGFISKGIPFISKQVAFSLPAHISTQLADGILKQLDDTYFEPSKLSKERRDDLRELFKRNLPTDTPFYFNLNFRGGGIIGANALALPDGTIVITDELIELAKNDVEILSVLHHEIGHVIQRHSLRQAFEGAGVGALFVWITGDVEAMTELVAVVPAILLQSHYSRDHEWEADGYALNAMQQRQQDPIHFANLMNRLDFGSKSFWQLMRESSSCEDEQAQTCQCSESEDSSIAIDEPETPGKQEQPTRTERVLEYLSSHPATEKRVQRFQNASSLAK